MPTRFAARPSTPEGLDTELVATILKRPDGFYWLSEDGKQEVGPFESREAAVEDRDLTSEEALAPQETLHEIERVLGLSDWIDAQSGAPAEGGSPPHLDMD